MRCSHHPQLTPISMHQGKRNPRPLDTLAITQSLGLQTFRKLSRRSWSKEDDGILQKRLNYLYPEQLATQRFDANLVNWEVVALVFGDSRKAKDCRKRWVALLDPHLRRGRWTEEEDRLLMELYNRHGPLWQKVAKSIEGRTEHQCSKRYMEILDPELRNRLEPWSENEDLLLVHLVLQHGTKWKTIASEFDLRPPLTCRNRWRNLVTAIVRGRASPLIVDTISKVVDGDIKNYFIGLSLPVKMENKSDGLSEPRHLRELSRIEDTGEISSPLKLKSREKFSSNYRTDSVIAADAKEHTNPHEGADRHFDADSPASRTGFQTFRSMSVDSSVSSTWKASSTEPKKSQEEWKYLILRNRDSGTAQNGSMDSDGSILSEDMVQYLVHYAARHNVALNVFHHVHHHYHNDIKSTHGLQYVDSSGLYSTENAILASSKALNSMGKDLHTPPPPPPPFDLTSVKQQDKQLQQFNYLSLQTEISQLASSVIAAALSSTHHHHHHHHHHRDTGEFKKVHEENSRSRDRFVKRFDSDPDPVTMGDLLDNFDQCRGVRPLAKKSKISVPDEGEEPEFFDSLRHLHGNSSSAEAKEITLRPTENSTEPVSQHHPLHYSAGTVGNSSRATARSLLFFDDDAEDMINSYGLFYHLYSNDTNPDKPLNEDAGPFEVIPFNPS